MQLAIIGDEISQDPDEVLSAMIQTGIRYLEIRMIEGHNVLDLSDDKLLSLRRLLERSGIEVCAIAAPLFKTPLEGDHGVADGANPDPFMIAEGGFSRHLELLEKAVWIARLFNTRLIRCFSFMGTKPYNDVLPQIVQHLSEAARKAEEADVVLCIENEPSCYARTSGQIRELLAQIPSAHIAALWDPGNAYYVGEKDLMKGFHNIRERVAHIHLKDIILRDDTSSSEDHISGSADITKQGSQGGTCEFTVVGRGILDYPGQIAMWRNSGYTGFLSLEPHLSIGKGSISGAIQSIQSVQAMLRPSQR
ncbi:MAG: sugar phosphate isomerase/epimerase [Firmicutes bacterium]|nr:sugar phosphate isomerase/epimerase [Bacillota bacterium]